MVRYFDLKDGNAQGVFGPADVLGTLNRQTSERALAAVGCVRDGRVWSLNAPLDWPNPSLFRREPLVHRFHERPHGAREDHLDNFYLQASSQWDGFLHVEDPVTGYYNGQSSSQLGIHHWARKGIVGRAVLLDLEAFLSSRGRELRWNSSTAIGVDDLEACRRWAGIEPELGDVLLVRTGWTKGWWAASDAEREAQRRPTSPGLAAGVEMAEFLWDWGLAAVASDNPALEVSPIGSDALHYHLLARLGMPIGELWWLDELTAYLQQQGRHDALLVSSPLHLPGGVGSTANALAIT